ncbi:thiolase family protein [Streptomyces boluensis]|uniref:Acetyl-CoA C-acyltransferase n=1 Tax=Streptomyces boluensis TaxID=1775135 RepID=A0A964UJ03_9ACTN|nr:thiolase family protein [Streptomyces boluensis]NBE50043.1 acetyl-CoA C-acyltransferase [Streptomyces boluensis]
MHDAVIVDAVRTPIAKGKPGGALSGVHPVDLSALVLRALAERNALDPALVDDVLWGCVSQAGEQSACIARAAVLAAGWPDSVPGVTVDRQCGSSQEAVHMAAAAVVSGQHDIVIAGGVESMSRIPMWSARGTGELGAPFGPQVEQRYGRPYFEQGPGAEMIAEEFGLSRTDLDQHALDSHERAARAVDEGRFAGQLVPVPAPAGDGGATGEVTADEGVRRSGTLGRLRELPTPFKEYGVISPGNSSQISDGAAALLVTTGEVAARHGWRPLARVHTTAVVGVDPITMLKGPIPATEKVLKRSGLSLDAIGTYEINEAFASVSLGWQRQLGADYRRLNPDGGAIALGHPLGASGARLMTTLVHRMRDQGIRYGLQAMCEGGGMANATLLERL